MNNQNKRIIDGLLSDAHNKKLNVIKISKHETWEHALAKCLVAIELIKDGNDIYTEAIFSGDRQLRADIIDISAMKAIEILHTEKEDNIKDYPLPIIKLKAEKVIKYWMAKVKR